MIIGSLTTEFTETREYMTRNLLASTSEYFFQIRTVQYCLILCALVCSVVSSLLRFNQLIRIEHAGSIQDRRRSVKNKHLALDLKKGAWVHHALDKAIGWKHFVNRNRKGAVCSEQRGFFRLDRSDFAGDAPKFMSDVTSERKCHGRTGVLFLRQEFVPSF